MKTIKKATKKAEAKPKVKTNAERINELKQQMEAAKINFHRLEGAIAILEQSEADAKN
jgi:hypothetical protein